MNLNLVDKLTLLALDDDKGTVVANTMMFPYALASAIILELALLNRIEIVDKKVKVIDVASTNEPIVDAHFEKIKTSSKERTIKHWVQNFGTKGSKIKNASIEKMVSADILSKVEGKILWVFTTHKYPTQNPEPELDLRKKLTEIIAEEAQANLEELILLNLVVSSDLVKEVFGPVNVKETKAKIKELAQHSASAKSMHKAIKTIHDELMMVVMLVATTVVVTS